MKEFPPEFDPCRWFREVYILYLIAVIVAGILGIITWHLRR